MADGDPRRLLDEPDQVIISHKYGFIFIKTAKTAGTSIEVFLSNHCGPEDILTPVQPPVVGHVPRNYRSLFNPLPEILYRHGRGAFRSLREARRKERFHAHIPAYLIRARVPKRIWTRYFKFCVERNPWDKTLSHYHMFKQRSGGTLSFPEYLERGRFCLNHQYYTELRPKGTVIVDRIILYEDLAEGLGEVFEQLGIPFAGSLGVRAKGSYRPDRRPYSAVYTDEQRRLIERVFAREIALHGYSF